MHSAEDLSGVLMAVNMMGISEKGTMRDHIGRFGRFRHLDV